MLSIKKISLLLIIVFSGVSKSFTVPDDSNYISANNWLLQECAQVKDTGLIECNFFFNFKQHSLSSDLAECYVYGMVKDSSPDKCVLHMPEHPCSLGSSQSWISKCYSVYYSESIDVRGIEKPQHDNVKIGSVRLQENNLVDPAFFSKESFKTEQSLYQRI
ncbi:hypothetical protein [Parasitella parasitica]|uniref:Uncharacterized protein n=1 Tax=Parasitella parasitica TaxID=35722 RepID=A0A0B7N0I3_9FUNG|nr:hypothetical protein [Parasitella parasitica]